MSATGSISNAKPRILLQFTQNKEGSVPAIRTVQDGPTTEEEYEDEDDGEDEVDQLVSTEDEGPPKAGTSASAAGASKPPRVRSQKVSVQPPIPLARLEGILDTEIGETMSKEAMFVLSAATDAFIKRMAEVGHRKANSMRRTTVTYHDMASKAN
ncbi:hypothetical protein BC835DRAFT_1332372 [Cytidiella melzeri]|nr:hypothetical protein BC835DRAFT_1332372 [Cytidiella melzeri]